MEKSVTQEDPMGCSIACVAFILGINYKQSKKYFKGLGSPVKSGYWCKDVVKALSRAGLSYDYKYIKRKIDFKEDTIVFIKRTKRYPIGHYLVKAKSGWMDPWINLHSSIKNAKSGFRKRLPSRGIYVVYPLD